MNIRVVFMGTPNIAVAMLERLLKENYHVVGVVTQPDKKVGRKQEIKMSEVKEAALAHDIPVFQPIKIAEDHDIIKEWKPDLIVTCAYGQFVPEEILNYPTYGSINIHASLLPKLRGGAPIHWAIIHGDKETGISIMRMVKKMDAGAVMAQAKVSIEDKDTMGDVYEKLKVCGADLLAESIPKLIDGSAKFIEQDEAQATFGYNIKKEEEKIDFTKDIDTIYNHIRGLIPFPVGYAYMHKKKVKFHKVRKLHQAHSYRTGELIGMMEGGYAIAVSGGFILLDELQMEGKTKTDAKSFYNGAGKNLLHEEIE